MLILNILVEIEDLDPLWANFILKLKYTLLLLIRLEMKLELNLKELSENFENNYHLHAFYFIRILNLQRALRRS